VFTNGGTEPCTIEVEFSGNVVSEDVWNGTSPPESPVLPSASRSGIVVGPGETVEVYPTSWLDLDNAVVLLAGETVPGAPGELAAEEEAGSVTLTWHLPADDGGLAITEYTVLRGDSDDDLSVLDVVVMPGEVINYVDETVERDHTYYYAVMARNLAGYGVACDAVSVEVPPLTAPGSPGDVNVTEEESVVTITWQPPADDGGSPLTGYVILRGTEPGNMAQLAEVGLVTEYDDTDVEPGETYYYQVRAVNAVGDGPESGQASVDVPKEEDPGDDGTPWLMYVAIIVVIVIVAAVVMMMRGKRGGPEASAPMMPETETEAEKTTQAPAMMK
jgi:hypothetical protein